MCRMRWLSFRFFPLQCSTPCRGQGFFADGRLDGHNVLELQDRYILCFGFSGLAILPNLEAHLVALAK